MAQFSDLSGSEQVSGFPRRGSCAYDAEEDACFFAQRNNKPNTTMHYVVTVTEVTQPDDSNAKDIITCERFKQHFPEPFDLNKFALALNQKPRGRKPKPAKEGAK